MRAKIYRRFSDNSSKQSEATRLRRQRFQILLDMVKDYSGVVSILDIGGRPNYWDTMLEGSALSQKFDITLLNYESSHLSTPHPRYKVLIGDGRSMPQFRDQQFDIVFSNSTIEHVGDFDDQAQMASEVRRIGKQYYVQTPNRYFPIEPHFVIPFFQFLPIPVRAAIVQRFDLNGYARATTWQDAIEKVSSIRLLTRAEMVQLFPGATIFEEKYYGLTKSFVAYTAKAQ
jgi:SAM-dependent methyltransferase